MDTQLLTRQNNTGANKVLPKAGLNGFNWAEMQGSTVVILLNFCAKNPRLRQAAEPLGVIFPKNCTK